jgi:hypothetical protein
MSKKIETTKDAKGTKGNTKGVWNKIIDFVHIDYPINNKLTENQS